MQERVRRALARIASLVRASSEPKQRLPVSVAYDDGIRRQGTASLHPGQAGIPGIWLSLGVRKAEAM
jgi:hypothetical protein